VHRTIMVVDVAGFSSRRRTRVHQVAIRDGLYEALEQAFGEAGIGWDGCYHEDRGDGVLILAPAQVPKASFAGPLPGRLAAALNEHNAAHGDHGQIRLRVALHAGEVSHDQHGVTGDAINLAFRLIDAPPLKDALAASPGVLALIASPWFYEEVIRHQPSAQPATWRAHPVVVKETATTGWIALPDHPYPSRDPAEVVQPRTGPALPVPRRLSAGTARSAGQGPAGPEEAAAQLAEAVGAQWRGEEERRRVHDPFPLPVRWHPVAADLMDHWANIRRAPAGADPGPLELAGRLDQVVDLYRKVPSGRLVVLGRSGAGKTVLAVRFVLDMLDARASTEPVPVIFGLGSWDPGALSLRGWLTGQLIGDHPALAAAGPHGTSLAAALIATGRILPVLDGFDEIASDLRVSALRAVSATGMPLLLTSRPGEYAAAAQASDVLTAAAVIELEDLTVPDLAGYLPRTTRRTVAGPDAARSHTTVWAPVLARLHNQDDPAARALHQVLATPLMITLTRAIYSDNPDRDPAELLDASRFGTPQAVEDHLLAAVIPAAYQHPPDDQSSRRQPYQRCDPACAAHWLGYLAWHLGRLGTRDLALWQIGDTIPRLASGPMAAAASAVMFGLAALIESGALTTMLTFAVAGGLSYAYGTRRRPYRAELRFRGTAAPFLRRFAAGAALGLGLGLDARVGLSRTLIISLAGGLALGSTVWLHKPAIVTAVPTPSAVLRQDRLAVLTWAFAAGLAFGTAFTLIALNPRMPAAGPVKIAVGAITGLAIGAVGPYSASASPWWPSCRGHGAPTQPAGSCWPCAATCRGGP
jgi:hypothetical protein